MLRLSPLEHKRIVSVALFNNDWFQASKRIQKGHKSIMKVTYTIHVLYSENILKYKFLFTNNPHFSALLTATTG